MMTQRTISFAVCFLFLANIAATAVASETEVRRVLEGKIVRSLVVDPTNASHVLIGQKGGAPGSAKVFQSRNGGETWHTLNGGAPLSPEATDVQAVAAVGEDIVLAGTWKHGLFISTDKGESFSWAAGFPSNDIRDFHVSTAQGEAVVYAATARNGIFSSSDSGKTWNSLGPSKDFFWSVTASGDGDIVYAVSLESATFAKDRRRNGWRKIFDRDDAYGLVADRGGRTLAIAAQTGGYVSKDGGTAWQRIEMVKDEKLSDVVLINQDIVVFGSWADGLVRLDLGGGKIKRFLPGVPVVHIAVAGDMLLVGTWGEGLKILPILSLVK